MNFACSAWKYKIATLSKKEKHVISRSTMWTDNPILFWQRQSRNNTKARRRKKNPETQGVTTKSNNEINDMRTHCEHVFRTRQWTDRILLQQYFTVRKQYEINRTLVQIYVCRRGAGLLIKYETIHFSIKDRTISTNLEYWLLDCPIIRANKLVGPWTIFDIVRVSGNQKKLIRAFTSEKSARTVLQI